MAYRYDERTGEFVDSPESEREPKRETYTRTTYPGTHSNNTTDTAAGGCLKSIGKLLLYWAIILAIAGFCSLFN